MTSISDNPTPDETKAELLRQRLAEVSPVERLIVASLPEVVSRLRRELLPLNSKSLGQVLLDPATDIAVLDKIKDYSKKLVAQSKSSHEHDVGIAIYFAAIASALASQNRKISSHSYEFLEVSFAELANKRWISPELSELFQKAHQISAAKKPC